MAQSTATADEMIAQALTAAPASIRDAATILDLSGNILRIGPCDMWSGTPYAHLMVPVAAPPEQRAVLTQEDARRG